jgi:hypothetical protein
MTMVTSTNEIHGNMNLTNKGTTCQNALACGKKIETDKIWIKVAVITNNSKKVKFSMSVPWRHIWGNGGTAPLILNLSTL